MNLVLLGIARFYPPIRSHLCDNPELTIEIIALINLLLRLKTREGIKVSKDTKLMLVVTLAIFFLSSCAVPNLSEILKDGANCKAEFSLPDVRDGHEDLIKIKVRIHDCELVTPIDSRTLNRRLQ